MDDRFPLCRRTPQINEFGLDKHDTDEKHAQREISREQSHRDLLGFPSLMKPNMLSVELMSHGKSLARSSEGGVAATLLQFEFEP
jgi:hypothetical protein